MPWWKFWSESDGEEEEPDYYQEGVELARREKYHEALTSFRLALRESPEDVAALEQMAVVYTRIGMTDEAIKSYRRALEQDSDRPAAHYGIAFLYLRRGEEEAAEQHLEAFLENPPPEDGVERHLRHARDSLQRIRGDEPEEGTDEG